MVVGAGYIGLELAEALCAWGVEITVVGRGLAPMQALDPDMGGLVATAMEGFGMDVRLGETVTGFDTHDGKVTAVVTDRDRGGLGRRGLRGEVPPRLPPPRADAAGHPRQQGGPHRRD